LDEIFTILEDRNLWLIKLTKEIEQETDLLRHSFDARKIELEREKHELIK